MLRRTGAAPAVIDAVTTDGRDDDQQTPVRFAVLGYGFGGRYFHAPLLAAAPECDLLGVVTSSAAHRAQVAGEPG